MFSGRITYPLQLNIHVPETREKERELSPPSINLVVEHLESEMVVLEDYCERRRRENVILFSDNFDMKQEIGRLKQEINRLELSQLIGDTLGQPFVNYSEIENEQFNLHMARQEMIDSGGVSSAQSISTLHDLENRRLGNTLLNPFEADSHVKRPSRSRAGIAGKDMPILTVVTDETHYKPSQFNESFFASSSGQRSITDVIHLSASLARQHFNDKQIVSAVSELLHLPPSPGELIADNWTKVNSQEAAFAPVGIWLGASREQKESAEKYIAMLRENIALDPETTLVGAPTPVKKRRRR